MRSVHVRPSYQEQLKDGLGIFPRYGRQVNEKAHAEERLTRTKRPRQRLPVRYAARTSCLRAGKVETILRRG